MSANFINHKFIGKGLKKINTNNNIQKYMFRIYLNKTFKHEN